jgi:hypothetical protein
MPTYSNSTLSTHENCPQKYKLKYKNHIKPAEEGIETFLGLKVHKALEYLEKEKSIQT